VPTLWPPATSGEHAFAQGLLHDLDVVAQSTTHDNLVLSYHYMSQFYSHDRLVNGGSRDRHYVVVPDRKGDDALFRDVDELEARYLPHGGTVWCVVPYALGPTNAARACHLHSPAVEVAHEHGRQAEITGFAVPTASAGSRASVTR